MSSRVKKDDEVVVIAGKDKGQKGRVMRVLREVDRVLVEGVNKVKRHTKPTPKNPQGGIIEREQPIHLSNVMPLDSKDEKPTRVKMGTDKDGKKVRQSVRSGTTLD